MAVVGLGAFGAVQLANRSSEPQNLPAENLVGQNEPGATKEPEAPVEPGAPVETEKPKESEAPVEPEATKEPETPKDTYYEAGRASLYGLNGQKIDLEAAYTNFEKALELGKTEANFYLGILCDWYNYPNQDYEKALAYYEAAADNPYAQLSLGFLYYNGQGVDQDKTKAQELFNAVIAQDCVEGYRGSASVLRGEKDYDTAFEYYNKVLEGKEQIYIASAMSEIGYMYHFGQGVEQNYSKAMEWYGKAADLGNPTAMNMIGYMYDMGQGVSQNYSKAMEWYGKAADLGSSSAMSNIGYMYANGLGVGQDYSKAMEWYEKAAALGNSTAMSNIGYMYERRQDDSKAMEWYEKAGNSDAIVKMGNRYVAEGAPSIAMECYEKAAALGNSKAMCSIGYMYLNKNGDGVKEDYSKAMEWFEKAADLGDSTAMENIGFMYENGLGVAQDLQKAQEWYQKAEAAYYMQ